MKSLAQIYEKYSSNDGGDKGTIHSYIDFYEKEMNKKQNITMLEIGIQFGYSIKMWEEYFLDSQVYGIDINIKSIIFKDLKNAILCDATNKEHVEKNFRDINFDYIIDDGSHLVKDQIQSFELFFPKIKKNGKYFIEDISSQENILKIEKHILSSDISSYKVYDLRKIKNRFDDILMVIEKK